MSKCIEQLEKRVVELEKKAASEKTADKKCCLCTSLTKSELQLENDEYICETCAQIMSEVGHDMN